MKMVKTAALLAVLATTLTACVPARFDELAYSVDVDADQSVALFTCRKSSSGNCVFRFDGNASPATATIAVNETGTVSAVGPGTSYCATSGADGAKCYPQTLQIGKQTVRHVKRRS
jgi:hypothetical protein